MIRRPPRTTRPDTCFHYPTLFRSIGPLLLGRYKGIFDKLYGEERSLAVRRDAWGFGLGLLGVLAYYGAYAWVAISTVLARITLGQMTMYLALFRNGQAAVTSSLSAISGMYEDKARKSVVTGTSVSVRVDLGGSGII